MKKIYFLRHATAVPRGAPGYPDDDRPLTDKGIDKFARSVKGIICLVDSFDAIVTSPLKRASETAAFLAREMNIEGRLDVTGHLLPRTNLSRLLAYLAKYRNAERILLVGHEPDLSSIISRIAGSPNAVVTMKKGALCRLDVDAIPPRKPGRIVWLLQPKILRKLG